MKLFISMPHIKLFILPTLVLALFAVSYFPALELLAGKWAASDDYTHAFFVVPIIGYMIWQRRDCLIESNGAPIVGLTLVVGSILFYLLSLQLQVPTFIFLATVVSIISAFLYIGGYSILKELAMPILLLFMIIPIPNQLLSMVTASLQLRISEGSEILLRMLSVPMFREGNVLHIQQKSFQVIEACSGIRSLISMTTLSILIGYFTLTRIWSVSLLFLVSIPVAIVINVVRVITLVLAFHYFKFDLSIGLAHTLTGMILFILGLALLFAFQRVLESWETKKQNN
ncbi:MAG: exosortase/archaeosortase family protein [Desulforhopalus sp.]